ncbi:efflux RND transporter periplasmic adaptor subunit [Phenylobacterium sp. LjRoot164]|uniref:efflux RND transporter periplasmic adaptor subunit n=1 Tax=unclassified Phenylobacterium TaxID=2640670 RepID=UPI003ECEF54E
MAGCGRGGQQAGPPPPMEVDALTLVPRTVDEIVELPGRVEAVRTAEVRARVDGIVERRLYEEGTDVREGAPLFAIDPREKRASEASARAALQRAQATLGNARKDLARYTPLVERKAISAQEFDAAQAAVRQGEADVASAEAALERAKLDLSYTTVTAPIGGRVGRAEVTEGALVSASQATLLTRVEQLSPIYVRFSLPNAEILELRRRAASAKVSLPRLDRVEVQLVLEDGSIYGPVGHLNFLDQAVDPSTGGLLLRAEFPNPERVLLPGQFVRARLAGAPIPNSLTVPQQAVQMSGENASVMVVGADGTVAARPVTLGAMTGDHFVVASGLKSGERVVVDGLQKVKPGQKVTIAKPKPAAAPPTAGKP